MNKYIDIAELHKITRKYICLLYPKIVLNDKPLPIIMSNVFIL